MATVYGNGFYVVRSDATKHGRFYGPFADRLEAFRAGYFARPVAKRDEATREHTKGAMRSYIFYGASFYTGDEINALVVAPIENDYRKVTVYAPEKCPMHASWKQYGEEFRGWLFRSDWQE